jgi:hypothetical protein
MPVLIEIMSELLGLAAEIIKSKSGECKQLQKNVRRIIPLIKDTLGIEAPT